MTGSVAGTRRPDIVAAICVAGWVAGAWASRSFGIWISLGGTSLLLAAFVLASRRSGLVGNGAHGRQAAVGALVGLIMVGGTDVIAPRVLAAVPALAADVGQLFTAFQAPGPLAAIALMPVIVICEEIVWRGAVLDAIARRYHWLPAAGVSGLVYALAHAPAGSPALVLTCFAVGCCWSALRGVTGSLPAVVVAHLVWDVAVLIVHQPFTGV